MAKNMKWECGDCEHNAGADRYGNCRCELTWENIVPMMPACSKFELNYDIEFEMSEEEE